MILSSFNADRPLGQEFSVILTELQKESPCISTIEKSIPLLAEVVSSSKFMNYALERLAAEPNSYFPEWMHGDQAVLWTGDNGRLITLKRIYAKSEATTITTLHGWGVIAPLLGHTVVLETYDADGEGLLNPMRRDLVAGQAATISPHKCAFDIYLNSNRTAPALLLCVFIFDPTWGTYSSYSKNSGKRLQEFAANLEDTRVDWALRVLGELGGQAHVSAIEKQLKHPLHFVRWTAMQSLYLIAPEKTREYLLIMKDDPHPDVRETACAALAQI